LERKRKELRKEKRQKMISRPLCVSFSAIYDKKWAKMQSDTFGKPDKKKRAPLPSPPFPSSKGKIETHHGCCGGV
jgi:hypothetical protein